MFVHDGCRLWCDASPGANGIGCLVVGPENEKTRVALGNRGFSWFQILTGSYGMTSAMPVPWQLAQEQWVKAADWRRFMVTVMEVRFCIFR